MAARFRSPRKKAEQDKELDKALEQTFPASDAVNVAQETKSDFDRPVHRRPPAIDKKLVEKLAEEVGEKQRKLQDS